MNIFKKLYNNLYNLWIGFFFGMKNTGDEIFTQSGVDNSVGTSINQQVSENRVSKALLKGEVTQEVEELRYRTYLIDRESKKFEYFSPMKAIRYDKDDSKFVKYDDSDGLKLITIQPNHVLTSNISDATEDIDFKTDAKLIDKVGNVSVNMGKFDVETKRTIEIERDFMPRFKLENYATRLVIKELDDNDNVILDFYVSKYPVANDMKSIYFAKAVEKLFNGERQNDLTDMEYVHFVTSHAYNLVDMLEYKFNHIYFREIVEYDGHYILRFKAHTLLNGIDLTEQYYSKTMDEKYKNNERKDVFFDMSGGFKYETFTCEDCGKVIEYNTDSINEPNVKQARDIECDFIDDDDESTSYFDLQISEQTFGKKLCKNCLKKRLNKTNKSKQGSEWMTNTLS